MRGRTLAKRTRTREATLLPPTPQPLFALRSTQPLCLGCPALVFREGVASSQMRNQRRSHGLECSPAQAAALPAARLPPHGSASVPGCSPVPAPRRGPAHPASWHPRWHLTRQEGERASAPRKVFLLSPSPQIHNLPPGGAWSQHRLQADFQRSWKLAQSSRN